MRLLQIPELKLECVYVTVVLQVGAANDVLCVRAPPTAAPAAPAAAAPEPLIDMDVDATDNTSSSTTTDSTATAVDSSNDAAAAAAGAASAAAAGADATAAADTDAAGASTDQQQQQHSIHSAGVLHFADWHVSFDRKVKVGSGPRLITGEHTTHTERM
jgi:hypothetical protein